MEFALLESASQDLMFLAVSDLNTPLCSNYCDHDMKTNPKKSTCEFAKIMTAACVRRGYLEKLHAGTIPITRTGDYSDVKVIDAEGREIPWNQVSRINQDEMKTLLTGIVDRIHTFLCRTFLCSFSDQEFNRALEKSTLPWTKTWDEPKYLPDFLMPVKGNIEK